MADNSILTPGYQDPIDNSTPEQEQPQYLVRDNFLSEYEKDEEKSVVRENLNVPSKDTVYTKQDVDTQVSQKIRDAIQEYLNMEDPHGILPTVEQMIADMVKTDGSTPFTQPQQGVDPKVDSHLTTKKYVDKLVKEHTTAEDPHNTLQEVYNILTKYVKSSDVFSKSQLYTKQDIDSQSKDYIRKDGTTPFTKAQVGADPQIDSHLATKRYVDKTLYNHLVDVDPHNFISILNQRLAAYAKRKDVFDKTQTYSRTQIDSIINKLVNQALEAELDSQLEAINDKFEYIRKQNYIKSDGSVAFKNPQTGVDATQDSELTTLGQITKLLETLKGELSQDIANKECNWITSGPVQTTVGFVEDNTELPQTLTFQEIMDAIFYGKSISISVPDYVTIGEKCPVTLCIHGSLGLVQYAELYQNGELIYTLQKEDFENGCTTVDSLPIFEDTEFVFKVYYTNGACHEVSATVGCGYPVFVGLLPKWKFAHTITMDYLKELQNSDTEGTQNRFIDCGNDVESITFDYQFQDSELRHPFIVLPKSYPDLKNMTTSSQKFGIEAFDVISDIPLTIDGIDNEVIFKIYVYRQALSSLNQKITFNFNSR